MKTKVKRKTKQLFHIQTPIFMVLNEKQTNKQTKKKIENLLQKFVIICMCIHNLQF